MHITITHQIIFGLLLILACSVLTMVMGHTGHLFSAFTPSVSNGFY